MKIATSLLFFLVLVLVNITYSFVVNEIGSVDQNELFRVDDETNPKSKAVCAVHKTTGTWQCIMNCVVVITDEEDVQMRQQRFKSCAVARALVRNMERNPFMAKHINMKFKNRMNDE